ncbi:MAG: bifunctional UDP-3-O-[3-hydroxymyristoyl] N-acetylglucosamine deacetylase/3-hydroxyacyl-ACP dehydratase [Bacteroidales bacterium]|nr:bifunctional UDP-3-O-[3-hydroxymyristoyl] N-acetylglucosamine deacetylase/3-hydroxyacyl-ACP dehydratase [Bacteroidales bacterium]
MMKQSTLKASFSVAGKGLHTGLNVEATFNPAPENTGYVFKRTDLEGEPIIEALAENVVATNRGTVIASRTVKEAKVATVEHALAALYAAGIDNCLIELNAPELPILDGSAIEYCNKIEEAGIVEQQADKEFYVVKQRIKVMDENTGSSLIVLPDDDFSIDTMIEFDSPVLPNQFASLNSLKDFKTEIASSRTFVFVREIQPLVENNLIKGGDLDNAIVIYDKKMTQEELDKIADIAGVPHTAVDKLGYLNHKPLTHPNEPARHKLLDVMGDLALIGRPLKGRIVATRPGHTINTKLSNQIRKELRYQNVQAPVYNPNVPPVMDINRIRELLPHRYPMQLVDKVIEISDNYIVGVKNVTSNEPFFQGHFPEEPVMPGVLQIEAMAQVGGLLVLNGIEHPETYSTYFMKIDNVKFRQKVVPGDTLIFHISFMTPMRRGCAVMKGYAFVGEKIVSEVEFMAQIIKNK